METRSAPKRKYLLLTYKSNEVSAEDVRNGDEGTIIISDLPSEIIHHILSFLPFKYAAQTCVLSKRWKHLWYTYPCFDLTNSSYFFNVDHVVTLLEKHSNVNILRFHGPLSPSGLVRLMKATTHNLRELDLVFTAFDSYIEFNLPFGITNSLALRDLRIRSWINGIRLPPLDAMKNGFKSLGSLSLSRVSLEDQPSFVNLFNDSFSFPSLTKLHLSSCEGLKYLRIQNPLLRDLCLENCYDMHELDVSVEKLEKLSVVSCFRTFRASTRVKIDAPSLERIIWSRNAVTEECAIGKFDLLKEAVVGLLLCRGDGFSDQKKHSVSNFLAVISRCQYLTIESTFIEILSRFNRMAGFQLCVFERLKSLKVHTSLSVRENLGLASIFRSCPIVDTIFIRLENDMTTWYQKWDNDFWESQGQSLDDSCLVRLKFVKILEFKEWINGVGLVKFLLKHGKALQQLSLPAAEETIKSRILGFSRASSSNAQIIFSSQSFPDLEMNAI